MTFSISFQMWFNKCLHYSKANDGNVLETQSVFLGIMDVPLP